MNALTPALAAAPLASPARRVLAGALFVGAFLFFWILIDPFVDLSDPASLLVNERSNAFKTATTIGLALCCLVHAWATDPRRLAVLLSPPLVLLFGWFGVTVVTAVDPALSAQRFVLTLMVFEIAAVLLLLPATRADFALLLAVAAVIVLAVCYAGVVLLPAYAVHQATEILEPQHAGHWRGAFTHKNGTGPGMVMLVIIGLFVAGALNRALGWAIALAAGIFLVRTGAKTAIGMVLPILGLAWIVTRTRSTALRMGLVVGGVALVNLFTVGSVVLPPVHAVLEMVMRDPTFTDRAGIWAFAAEKALERPLLGQGFGGFWGTDAVALADTGTWTNTAPHSHNGYLDVLLTTGLPGLVLAILALLIAPLRDLARAERSGNDPVTTLFFTRLWLFCVFFACLEGFFFLNGGPTWFVFVMTWIAVLGLRFQAASRLVTGARAAGRLA